MVLALLATALLVLVTLVVATLTREVRHDGYGHRSAPPSHEGWGAAGLPSAPFRTHATR